MNVLWVFIGGGIGSVLRYGISWLGLKAQWYGTGFPWATLIANLIACAVMLGLISFGLEQSDGKWRLAGMIGFCGGLSTFSTFSLENYRLMEQGLWGQMLLNILLNTLGCLLIFFLFSKRMSV